METLRPSEIRYSQDSIGCRFSDGTPLTSVFAHLISGSLKVTDLPEIEVVEMDGHWWARTGNRRLFLYRKLEDVGMVETIDVIRSWISPTSDSFRRKFTTVCEGLEIVCRQDFLESSLDEIVSDWQSGEDLVAKWDRSNRVLAERFGYREDTDTDQSDDDESSQDEDDQSEDDQDEDEEEDAEDAEDEEDEDDQDEDDQSEDDQDEDDEEEDDEEEDDQDEDDEEEDDKDEDDQDEDEKDESEQSQDDQDEDNQDKDDDSDEDEDGQDEIG